MPSSITTYDSIKNVAYEGAEVNEKFSRESQSINELRKEYENPHSYHMAEATEYLANDIVERFLGEDVRQTPPTFADRQAAKLDKAITRGDRFKAALKKGAARRKKAVSNLKNHHRTKESKAQR